MAVSKRLRFEILRRDNHTCRYCGESAPGTKLVIDHVVPEALGGRGEPENLVTACEPCNSGKSSIAPDAPIVHDVAQDAMRWARAIKAAAAAKEQHFDRINAVVNGFLENWNSYKSWGKTAPLPDDWHESVLRFHSAGLTVGLLEEATHKAMTKSNLHASQLWRYFCGCCWGMIKDITEAAASSLLAEEADA